MTNSYPTTQESYSALKVPCAYCLAGKCAERKAAGLCHCGDHTETPQVARESSTRTSKESELVTEN